MKKLLSLMALFVISLLTVSMVSAVSDESTLGSLTAGSISVEVNGEELDNTTLLTVARGEEVEVEVTLKNEGNSAAKNIEVEARLMGYDEEDVKGSEIVEKVAGLTKEKVTLKLKVPSDFPTGTANLKVFVYGGNDMLTSIPDYELHVELPNH